MGRRKALEHEEPLINLTPLIDVVFVVLIMFIVVAPILQSDRVELASGGGNTKNHTVSEKSPITLHVHANNTVELGGKRVSLADLPSLLQRAKKEHPQAKPQVFHDKRAHFGTYQQVKNSVEAAGFDEMDIVLSP